jgi:hypothetical protein
VRQRHSLAAVHARRLRRRRKRCQAAAQRQTLVALALRQLRTQSERIRRHQIVPEGATWDVGVKSRAFCRARSTGPSRPARSAACRLSATRGAPTHTPRVTAS